MTLTEQDLPSEAGERYFAGDTLIVQLQITGDDGTAKNLDGASVHFQLLDQVHKNPVLEKTLADDVEIVDALNGDVKIKIFGNETEELGSAGGMNYDYRVRVSDDVGNTSTVTAGTLTVYD